MSTRGLLRHLRKQTANLKYIAISFLCLIAVWELAVRLSGVNEALFPSPASAWNALLEICIDGTLVNHIYTSMLRFFAGFIVATVLAVVTGVIFGWFDILFKLVNPVVQLLRPISPIAWMPFIVLMFGIGDMPAVVTIFIAAFFPVFLSTVSGVKNIPEIYLKVARNFAVGKVEIFWKIIFPASFPQITSGIHLALGSAWVFLVCGEMIGAQSGLGYLIIDARNNLRSDILVADIVIIGLIGLLLDTALKYSETLLLKTWGLVKE